MKTAAKILDMVVSAGVAVHILHFHPDPSRLVVLLGYAALVNFLFRASELLDAFASYKRRLTG